MPTAADAGVNEFDPFAAETIENPHPFFAALRREAPLYELPNRAYWLVSRFEDCRRIVLDTDTFSSRLVGVMIGEQGSTPRLLPLPEGVGTNVLAIADPPDHTRQRKLVNRAFAPRRVAALEPAVRTLVDELLDAILTTPQVSTNLMANFAVPLPMTVICQLLGLPLADRHELQTLSDDAIALVDGINTVHQVERYARSAGKLGAYLGEQLDRARASSPLKNRRAGENEDFDVLARRETGGKLVGFVEDFATQSERQKTVCSARPVFQRAADPGEDVLGTLAAAVDQPNIVLSRDEAVAILVQLLTAGQETTGGLIGSAIMLLGRDARLQEELCANPSLIPSFIEETLRLESPFYGHFRQATRDTTIAGQAVAAGTKLMVLWASANRDEAAFARADQIDLRRPNPKNHFAFGHGVHLCIGAELARMEAQLAIGRLLERTSRIALDDPQPRHLPSLFVRRLMALPVTLTAR